MRKTLLLIVVTMSSHYLAIGQSTCTQTLRLAQSAYDQGRLQELPALIQNCLKNGFTNQERINAYKLLTLTYIYLEEPGKADEEMLNLLKADPYFKVNSAVDPAEFIALYRTFRTEPIYRLGVNIGVNTTQPNVTERITTNQGDSKYKNALGFQAGIVGEIPLTKKLTLNPGVLFQQKAFDLTNRVYRGLDEVTNVAVYNTTTAQEKQNWVTVPLSVQYILKDETNFIPYLSLGITPDLLLASNVTTETLQDNAGAVQQKTIEITRERFNISATASAGIKMRIFGGYMTAELKYLYGLTKVNSANTYYQNIEINFNNNVGDALFRLSSLSITAGYVQNIFKPKKLQVGK
ncbi:porin family protein [Chryseosolibacter indicus]|uniref:Outer membrane beta-barrel protein n=1 Tax=Chryseosolibacter indicus TaxID=2782351 RepID=A0ABS5VWQ0_9BACT|nr:porin family protein [Chryseosolibacter indicus]MBT1705262.1 outer membrane beta-barrel protein [Chryseosolibacter indicus]